MTSLSQEQLISKWLAILNGCKSGQKLSIQLKFRPAIECIYRKHGRVWEGDGGHAYVRVLIDYGNQFRLLQGFQHEGYWLDEIQMLEKID